VSWDLGEMGKVNDADRIAPEVVEEEEEDSEDDDQEEDDDDEIIMPDGPPPGSDAGSDDSDDIPLPEGPPPPKSLPTPPLPPGPSRLPYRPPFPGQGQQQYQAQHPQFMPQPMGMPFRPPMQQPGFRPVRPPIPRDQVPNIQDPLSDGPAQTYQGHRIQQHALPVRPTSTTSSTLPPNTSITSSNIASTSTATAEISAAPVMRDLRKEAVAFVPRGVKRKQAKVESAGVELINAAPGQGVVDEDGDEVRKKRMEEGGGGLMGKLKGVLGSSGMGKEKEEKVMGKGGSAGDDDYQDFLKGLGELG
jgi:hypothetical protein